MQQRRELGPHVSVLFGHEQGKYPDGNTVLVCGTEATMAIDPALSARTASLEVDVVALTHAHEDHVAGVSAVAHRTLMVHEADAPALRDRTELMRMYGMPEADWPAMDAIVAERFHYDGWPDAQGFAAGAVVDLGGVTVRAVHAPGHTRGHTVFLIEPDGVLVTGDIDLSTFGPYYGDAYSDLDDFESTLREVRGIEARHYVTFHHKAVIDGHEAFAAAIDSYAGVIGRRSAALLALLDDPRTFEQLVEVGILYRPGTRPAVFGESAERYTIRRHLERLVREGRASSAGSGATQEWARA
ncbi:MAG: MBL fold metallo-hydrolase [Ilumatobacteraceae bacterium]